MYCGKVCHDQRVGCIVAKCAMIRGLDVLWQCAMIRGQDVLWQSVP